VIGTRLILAFLLAIGFTLPALAIDGGGFLHRKSRLDPVRVRQLIEIVRSEPDARKRRSAVMELADADPRLHVDVIPTLAAALRKDAADSVRIAAAEVIGKFNIVYPLAGIALEEAAAADSSQGVRRAARQALWEYHLIGYQTPKAPEGLIAQTVEPPIASPAHEAVPLAVEPSPVPVTAAAGDIGTPTIAPLPPVGPPPGPRITPEVLKPSAVVSAVQPHPNLTVEPPIARRPAAAVSVPPPTSEPPIRGRILEPVKYGPPPRLATDLPPIVPPPGGLSGVAPLSEPTAEPPLAKVSVERR